MGVLRVVLTVIMIVISIIMTIVILMQEGKSQGLGAIAGQSDTKKKKNKVKHFVFFYLFHAHLFLV